MLAVRGAMTGASVEESAVVGAIPIPDATVLETVTEMMTVATDGRGVASATKGAATGSAAMIVGAAEEVAMEALVVVAIGCVSKKKSLRPSTSHARRHPISPASPISCNARVA